MFEVPQLPEGGKPLVYSSAMAKFADDEATQACGYDIWIHTTSPVLPTSDAAYEWAKSYIAASTPAPLANQAGELERLKAVLNRIADLGSCANGKTPAYKLFQQAIDIATSAL